MEWKVFSAGKNVDSVQFHKDFLRGGYKAELYIQEAEVQQMHPDYYVQPLLVVRVNNDIFQNNKISYTTSANPGIYSGLPVGYGDTCFSENLVTSYDQNHPYLRMVDNERCMKVDDDPGLFGDDTKVLTTTGEGKKFYYFTLHKMKKTDVIDLTADKYYSKSGGGSGGGGKRQKTSGNFVDLTDLEGGWKKKY